MKSPSISLGSSLLLQLSKALLRDYHEIDGLRSSPGSLRLFLQKAQERTEKNLLEGFSREFPNFSCSFVQFKTINPKAEYPTSYTAHQGKDLLRKKTELSLEDKERQNVSQDLSELSQEIYQQEEKKGEKKNTWLLECSGWDNFLAGFPFFSVSALKIENNKSVVAMTYDPLRNELFWTQKGYGAFLNNRRLRLSPPASWQKPLITLGSSSRYVPSFLRLFPLRGTGNFPLDMAYISCGRLHGGFLSTLGSYGFFYKDFGTLFVQEAGGTIEPMKNSSDFFLGSSSFVKYILSCEK